MMRILLLTTLFYFLFPLFSIPDQSEDLALLERDQKIRAARIRTQYRRLKDLNELLDLREASIRTTGNWLIHQHRHSGGGRNPDTEGEF